MQEMKTPPSSSPEASATWSVYVVRCADDTLYCGVTTNLARRLAQHNGLLPGGARYTRGRRPVTLAAHADRLDKQTAHRLEHHIKTLPRAKKLEALKAAPKAEGAAQTS